MFVGSIKVILLKRTNYKSMKLYYHKTDGGAEYLTDTFIECDNGHKEGTMNDKTKYIVRIDGDITKDAGMEIREN